MIHPSRRGIICDLSGKHVLKSDGNLVYYSVSIDKVSESSSEDEHVLDLDISEEIFNKWQEQTKIPRCAFCGQNCSVDNMVLFNKIEVKKIEVDNDNRNKVDVAMLKKMCSKCFEELRQNVLKVVNQQNRKIK